MMSRRKDESNPFFCGDEDDDGYSFGNNRSRNAFDEEDDILEQLQAKKHASERRQIESQKRSLALIAETEDVGNATAEELLHQREQLDNAERNLDSINSTTKITQRQLNSIKSVFGGIKNWFRPKGDSVVETKRSEVRHSRLRDTTDGKEQNIGSRSVSDFRTKRLEEDEEDDFKAKSDQYLDSMTQGIHRLKGLALNLGDEIEDSNRQLDRLQDKAGQADAEIFSQNQQMRKLLNE